MKKNERVQNVFSVYKVNDVRTVDTLPKCETVTLKTQWGSLIKFQIDNGASVNVIPLSVYELASKDFQHRKIKKSDTTEITAFGGTRWKIKGEVIIRVQGRNKECLIRLKIADGDQFHSILGRSASVELGCIKILDNDEKYEQVNQIQNTLDLKILMTKYPEVFDGQVGKLEGKYTIKINDKAVPVKHAQRTVSVPLREKVRQKLKELEKNKIIQKVNEPSEWISSMVVKIKKSGDIRICLDPKDLNKEICREHYPLPVIEEIATRLSNAKVFSIFDVKNGFWHVELDTKSSMLTTFNTPFGRYRWNRLPFGISSAPEVFQRKMHEISEGLDGVEVVADDFLIIGYGKTEEEGLENHDKNLIKFLQRCRDKSLHLNAEKVQLRKKEINFIGHIATVDGITVGEGKIEAIQKMQAPTDPTGVKRILGMCQYLTKFLPNFSDKTVALRKLTEKRQPWQWTRVEEEEFKIIKEAITKTPVLRYYDVDKVTTIQCDASKDGLGGVLLQGDQPIAYISRALTKTETRYAQIEKELLAIVFSCKKFHTYIYGKEKIKVDSDHKPLERIFNKELNDISLRMQRMRLKLQRYDLEVRYRPGKELLLADALSRNYMPYEEHVNICTTERETMARLAISDERMKRFIKETNEDDILKKLKYKPKQDGVQRQKIIPN